MAVVTFNSLLPDFQLAHKRVLSDWIQKVVLSHHRYPLAITFVFCSDEYLQNLNAEYLHRKSLTDIITFNYNESFHISGDIFISIDRVGENARKFKVPFENELHRVMVHGVLHLLGHDDKSSREKKLIRMKEDEFLAQLHL